MNGFIAGFVFAPLFGAIGISGTLANVLGGLILAAGSMILAWLLAPPVPKPEDGHTAIQQTTPFRSFGYGTARTSGCIILKESYKGSTILEIHAIAAHRIDGFRRWYLNDDEVFEWIEYNPPDGTIGQGMRVKGQDDGRYGHEVYLYWRYGLVPESGYNLFSPSDNDPSTGNERSFTTLLGSDLWPLTARGDGIAAFAMTAADAGADNQQRHFPNGAPQPSCVADFAAVYDPRDPAQQPIRDGMTDAEREAAEATWLFSRNPALCILHWQCFSPMGYRRSFDKIMGMAASDTTSDILEEWKKAADICDEQILLSIPEPVGADPATEKRYELGGWATTEQDPKEILAQLLASCDGWTVERGDGTVILRCGKFVSSGATIGDDDILGFHYQRGLADEDCVNRLTVQFTSPDHHYSTVECDPWENAADQINRGIVRDQQYKLDWVQSFTQARRIALREFKRLNFNFRGTLDLRLSGINAAYERYIYCAATKFSAFSNCYIETRGAKFDLEHGGVRIEFVGIDPTDMETWGKLSDPTWQPGDPPPSSTTLADLKADEGTPPPLLDDISREALKVPSGLVCTYERFQISSVPSTYGYRIVATWVDDEPDITKKYKWVIRWRVKDLYDTEAGLQPGPWHEETHSDAISLSPGYLTISTGVITTGVILEIEMAGRAHSDNSDWSAIVELDTTGI